MAGDQSYDSMEYNPSNSAVYRAWLSRQPHGRSWDKWLLMVCSQHPIQSGHRYLCEHLVAPFCSASQRSPWRCWLRLYRSLYLSLTVVTVPWRTTMLFACIVGQCSNAGCQCALPAALPSEHTNCGDASTVG